MMLSQRSREGYLQIDHRACEGRTDLPVPSGMNFESATVTCSHCQRVVVLNPDRSRSRGYCPKCDHYVCDQCEVTRVASGGICRPFKQVIDEALERAVKLSA